MRAWIVIPIILLVTSVAYSKEIADGVGKSINSGTLGSGGEYDAYKRITTNDRTLRDYRDPSQYSTYPYEIPRRSNPGTTGSDNNGEDTDSSTSGNRTMTFQMTSDVIGNGSLSERKTVQDVAGLNTKQTSSAFKGNVILSNRMAVFQDRYSNGAGLVVSKESAFFVGNSFCSLESYSNNGDLIQNRFQSGNIYKDSTYFGNYFYTNSSDIFNISALKVRQTTYDLTTQFVGTASLSAHLGNETEIAGNYAGQIAINTSLSDLTSYNLTYRAEWWLPCNNCE